MLDVSDLVDALRRVASGGTVVDPALVAEMLARRSGPERELTEREHEVLALMAEGLTDRGIAERLVVAPKTVQTHVRHILSKLGAPATVANNRRVLAILTYLHPSGS